MRFSKWLESTADDVTAGFKTFGSGIGLGAEQKRDEYAKRILNGESPEQVMIGIRPNGSMWNLVMGRVGELKRGQAAPQVSLSSLAGKVSDLNWHQVYDVFARQHSKVPNDPEVQKMGQALFQAAQSGNMNIIQPYIQKYVHAQRIS